MQTIFESAEQLAGYSIALRRDLHQHPELGFQEVRTAGIIARELHALNIETITGLAQTGVVGLIEGARPGPVVLLRVDMDALPITEQTGAPYASQTPGVMHACGHDAHVAIGLTAARLLAARRETLCGTVKLMFQPAEEGLGGAEGMIAAGVLDQPQVDYALSLHVWNDLPLGTLGIPAGPLMAGGDIFDIVIHGRGGHGALPHQSADPIVAAAQVISALQTIVGRNVTPLEAAVVSVGRVQGGEAFNVIPAQVTLSGTIRTFLPEVRETVLRRFEEIVVGVSAALGCRAEVDVRRLTPAVINDARLAALALETARQVLPEAQIDTAYRTMVSEDMAYLMERVPGCYVMVGAANPQAAAVYGHHHPRFDLDEGVLPRAAALMAALALRVGTEGKA